MKRFTPAISPKQLELLRLVHRRDGHRKFILVNGPRFAAKTVGCLHAVVSHCWNTNGAVANILVPTTTVGTDSGCWTLLTERIIPEWIGGGFGMDWAPEGTPRQHPVTKKFYCLLTNKFGTTSRIEVNSLKEERDVETNFKNRYFSMIYWPELSLYRSRDTFSVLIHSLRLMGVPEEQHVMLCDTNPSDEGEDSWIYKLFYRKENEPESFRKCLHVIEFSLDENPFLTEERKREIRDSYRYDPTLYARLAEGKWVKTRADSLFADIFRPNVHVVGDQEKLMVPQPDAETLMTGWDFGPVNPAVVFVEPFMPNPDGPEHFKCFDELVMLDTEISVGDFTRLVLEKMQWWEEVMGRKVKWQHWSDRSAFDMLEPISLTYQHEEVLRSSGGQIRLNAVERGRGSVAARIRLWRMLLHANRLFFSASKTPKLIAMHREIRPGRSPYSIAVNDPNKHVFDAASYAIARRCWDELEFGVISVLKDARSKDKRKHGWVPVPT